MFNVDNWEVELQQDDLEFLKHVGVVPCDLDDPYADPPPFPEPEEPCVELIPYDLVLLKNLAISWPVPKNME